jgi:hypothetical protein
MIAYYGVLRHCDEALEELNFLDIEALLLASE